MQDKILKCRDCGQEFVFTAGEQDFYALKGFGEPSRCSACRAARKMSRGETSSAAPRSREMFPATCGRCGKSTQVPFEPRAGRPVYCSDCFSSQRPAGGGFDRPSRGGNDRRSNGGRSGGFGGRGKGRGGDRYDDRW